MFRPAGPGPFNNSYIPIRDETTTNLTGFPELSLDRMPRLKQILKGVQVELDKQGRSPCHCLPITPAILRKLRAIWLSGNPSFNDIMLWAACVVTFFLLLQIWGDNSRERR